MHTHTHTLTHSNMLFLGFLRRFLPQRFILRTRKHICETLMTEDLSASFYTVSDLLRKRETTKKTYGCLELRCPSGFLPNASRSFHFQSSCFGIFPPNTAASSGCGAHRFCSSALGFTDDGALIGEKKPLHLQRFLNDVHTVVTASPGGGLLPQ